jgi:hypothetical protein
MAGWFPLAAAAPATTATFNPAFIGPNLVLSNGNLTATNNVAAFTVVGSTVSKSSGKFYAEFTIGASTVGNMEIGLSNASQSLTGLLGGVGNNSVCIFFDGTECMNNTFGAILTPTWVSGSVVCMAVDLTAAKIWWRVNGGNWNAGVLANQNPATGAGGFSFATMNAGPYFPAAGFHDSGEVETANFGATSYAQTVPSGFGNWQ